MIFKYEILEDISLRDYLNSYFISKSKIYTLFLEKRIKINGDLAKEKKKKKKGDLLSIDENQEIDYAIDKESIDVVYEDDYLLIINKPKGIIIHDDDKQKLNTLSNRVAKYYKDNGWDDKVNILKNVSRTLNSRITRRILSTSTEMSRIRN